MGYKLKNGSAAKMMAASPLFNTEEDTASGGSKQTKHQRQMSNMQKASGDSSKNVFDRVGDTLIATENPMGVMMGYGVKNHPVNLTYKGAKAIGGLFKK